MTPLPTFLLLLALAAASPVRLPPLVVQDDPIQNSTSLIGGWQDPRLRGGRFLDFTTPDYGEPLNVIISGLSDPFILTESGLHEYAKSIGFSEECLGLHYGKRHSANLGDGDGRKIEQFLARQYYFPIWGTCWESLAGGNHFRAWKQDGARANSGAWFIGVSKEEDSSKNHRIIPNGYNLGRDWLVDRAVSGSKWRNNWWKADVEWRTGLLHPGNKGVNHGIPQDGRVAVLNVQRMDASECSEARRLLRDALTATLSDDTSMNLGIQICPQAPAASDSFLEVVDPRAIYAVALPAWIWLWFRIRNRWLGARAAMIRGD